MPIQENQLQVPVFKLCKLSVSVKKLTLADLSNVQDLSKSQNECRLIDVKTEEAYDAAREDGIGYCSIKSEVDGIREAEGEVNQTKRYCEFISDLNQNEIQSEETTKCHKYNREDGCSEGPQESEAIEFTDDETTEEDIMVVAVLWECPICGADFRSEKRAVKHIIDQHRDHLEEATHIADEGVDCETEGREGKENQAISSNPLGVFHNDTRGPLSCFSVSDDDLDHSPGKEKEKQNLEGLEADEQSGSVAFNLVKDSNSDTTVPIKKKNEEKKREVKRKEKEWNPMQETEFTRNSQKVLRRYQMSLNPTDWQLEWPCPICMKRCDSQYKCERHIVKRHDYDYVPKTANSKPQRKYARKCKKILRRYRKSIDDVEKRKDIRIRRADKEKRWPCPICGKVCHELQKCELHVIEFHNGQRPIKGVCEYCGKSFHDEWTLDTHLRVHTRETVQCDICKVQLCDKYSLQHHHESVHLGGRKKPHSCHLCSKTYATSWMLRQHIPNHFEERNFSCKTCGAKFKNERSRNRHEQNVHQEDPRGPFECKFCGKLFRRWKTMYWHRRTHDENRREFKCSFCERTFLTKGGLVQHETTHTNVRRYECSHCGKRFASRSNLDDHVRIHTGEKPYVCDLCGKAFTKKSNLNTHKKGQNSCARRVKNEKLSSN